MDNSKTRQIINGWCNFAEKISSANFDARPKNTKINLIVIHGISLPPKVFRGHAVIDFFQNKLDINAHDYYKTIAHLKVSAHFFIRRRGRIIQLVSTENRAWHAGVSTWRNFEQCNNFSIGIELEGSDDLPYTNSQYINLNILITAIKNNYPIEDIVGHCDIAPGRKTDPGQFFDWTKIKINND